VGIGLGEVLTLMPTSEGTAVTLAKEMPDVVNMHQAGIGLAEIIGALTRPKEAVQLSFLGS
jgi:hypothetical protein